MVLSLVLPLHNVIIVKESSVPLTISEPSEPSGLFQNTSYKSEKYQCQAWAAINPGHLWQGESHLIHPQHTQEFLRCKALFCSHKSETWCIWEVFLLVDASKETSSKCWGLALQQGGIPRVWRCHCFQSTSQLCIGVAQPQKNIWEAKKNLYPHLGFLQEQAEKDFKGIGKW